jgi:hypothetical protein
MRSASRRSGVRRTAWLAALFVLVAAGSRPGTISAELSEVRRVGRWHLNLLTNERGGVDGCVAIALGLSSASKALFSMMIYAAEPEAVVVSLLDPYGERSGFALAQTGHEIMLLGSGSGVAVGTRIDQVTVRFAGATGRLFILSALRACERR